jgi:16S rRNA U516 pseudouridylate synthase RsuA-like enzyme
MLFRFVGELVTKLHRTQAMPLSLQIRELVGQAMDLPEQKLAAIAENMQFPHAIRNSELKI